MIVETIKIKAANEQGYIVINKSDFNKEKQELYTGEQTRKTRSTVKKTVRDK